MAELDLDSLLRDFSSSSSDEDHSSTFRRRTVDEILNDSDSDDSNSSMPQSLTLYQDQISQKSTSLILRSSSSSSSSFSSAVPTLPSLFGSVRPASRPGAALAAAAAAARPVLTPYAERIKTRRAESIQKIEASDSFQAIDDDVSGLKSEGKLSILDVAVSEELVENAEEIEDKKDNRVDLDLVDASDENDNEADDDASPLEEVDNETESDNVTVAEEDQQTNEEVVVYDQISSHDTELNGEIDDMEDIDDYEFFEKSLHDGELNGEIEENIDLLMEERSEHVEDSKKSEEKLAALMKPLELAEELEKKHASYGLHWEEGAAAQPMRLEGIRRGPPAVGYLQIDLDNVVTRTISSQMFRRDYGSPQVVAVHMNYVAMGTSKGAVLVFPSKYSAQSVDRMDSKMLIFNSYGTKSQASVTSMCFNQVGELLLVGYGDGSMTLWDVQRASIAKVMAGEHSSPVVHTLFLGQFKAVTGDSKGLVFLHTISVVPLLNRFSVKSQCLLDGQKNGIVLSISPLLMDESHGISYNSAQGNSTMSTSGLGSMVGGVVGGVVGSEAGWKLFNEGSSLAEEGVVIFVTHQNAVVIRLTPTVEVYDKFSKPDGVREGSMPYTAWKCTTHSHDSSPAVDATDKAPWLVVAWDRRVQVAQLVKSKMKNFREWSLDSTAIGVAWLDDQMLVVLTLRGQLCLFSKDGSELHRTSFAVNGSSLDDIISYHTHLNNTYGNPEKAYHNSVSVRGATIYLLGPIHLLISRLLPWKERIQVLQRAGDWMGALDMAMRLYDGQAQGVIDLPRNVEDIREAIMPYLVELLLSYVDEVFSYISVAFCNQIGKFGQLEDTNLTNSSVQLEIEEQYARVGGVAVEFCVHIKRTDILFDVIFSKFVAVEHGGTFLEILEPYILKDMLGCLPPGIMQALVEHYSAKGWLQRVEQCVLHMDIASLDFNQVVKLCREHGLFGALIYLFNKGLDDFRAPLEELLVVIQNSSSTNVSAIGYRMLVYLKYCFQGLAFPPGHGSLPSSCLPSVRTELLQFLLGDSSTSVSSENFKKLESLHGNRQKLCYLLLLDTEATLDVLKHAFPEEKNLATLNREITTKCLSENIKNQEIMAQNLVNVLISILGLESDVIKSFTSDDNTEIWPSKKDMGHLLEFIVFLVACNGAKVSGKVIKHILEYLTLFNSSKNNNAVKEEKQVLSLLKAVPQTEWDSSCVLHLCSEAHFYQACGFILSVSGQYIASLDSYMKDVHEPIHAFAFINNMLLQMNDLSFRSAVLSRISELVKLSRECTYFLVIDHFSSESQNILTNLHSHPESLFLFLKTAIEVHLSGSLKFSFLNVTHVSNNPNERIQDMSNELEAYLERFSNNQKLLRQNMIDVTDEIAELYLELLCKYERNSVLKFLETFDNYRLEHCLRLCQEYEVIDAAAFLLERAGDVGSALGLVMAGLNEKIDKLVASIENKFSEATPSIFAEKNQFTRIFKSAEVINVHNVLNAAVGLCQRNTQRLNQQESESLWFRLLDSFSSPLRRFYHGTQFPADLLSSTLDGKLDESDFFSRLRVSKIRKCQYFLRRIFSKFVGEIIEGMFGYISLPSIMAKLLSDNGNQEFGDFKLTIMKMLGTYGYEKRILDTARSLIEDDTYYTMGILKKGATHAFVPQDSMCCICGCSLFKGSTTSGIRLFQCGHSTHIHCESEENEISSNRHSSIGCPICLTKKNSRAKNKSAHLDSGLVSTYISSSRPLQAASNAQHGHESELDKHYGLQQMSRFEILSNLQNSHKFLQKDTLPQLKLSPPAVYHEKVQMAGGLLSGETSSSVVKNEKSKKRWQLKEFKTKGALNRFPLKSSLFGPEKNRIP